jgi:hypothetical protein
MASLSFSDEMITYEQAKTSCTNWTGSHVLVDTESKAELT